MPHYPILQLLGAYSPKHGEHKTVCTCRLCLRHISHQTTPPSTFRWYRNHDTIVHSFSTSPRFIYISAFPPRNNLYSTRTKAPIHMPQIKFNHFRINQKEFSVFVWGAMPPCQSSHNSTLSHNKIISTFEGSR